jgi:hypothetical protein
MTAITHESAMIDFIACNPYARLSSPNKSGRMPFVPRRICLISDLSMWFRSLGSLSWNGARHRFAPHRHRTCRSPILLGSRIGQAMARPVGAWGWSSSAGDPELCTMMIGLSANDEKRYHARHPGFHGRSRYGKALQSKETIMRERFSGLMITVAIAGAAVGAVISVSITRTSAQAPAASGTVPTPASTLTTPWGEPDLQGIWTDETDRRSWLAS